MFEPDIIVSIDSSTRGRKLLEGSFDSERSVCIAVERLMRDMFTTGDSVNVQITARDEMQAAKIREYLTDVGKELQIWPLPHE